MQAPLGLAVIGGLVMSTFATLLVLPSVFAVVIGRSVARSPSIYPDDPDSIYHDPLLYAPVEEKVTPRAVEQPLPARPQPHQDNHAADSSPGSGTAPPAPVS
jgi:hypothetical protein